MEDDMKKSICIAVLIAVVCATGAIAGSVTQTNVTWQSMNTTEIQWVITTNQNVSGSITGINGELERIVIVAGGAGTTNTITLTDQDGVDVFLGQGSESGTTINLYADNGDTVLPIAISGTHTLLVTNATLGVSATTNGTIRLYWR